MTIVFSSQAWNQLCSWLDEDVDLLKRLTMLIESVRREPFKGLGKPEPLRGPLSGFWSRRISQEHRLVYRVAGRAGVDQRLEIASCRTHYAH